MKRPAVHNAFRFAFVAFGICCFVFAVVKLSSWRGYKKMDSVVQFAKFESPKYGTNTHLEVAFVLPSGISGYVRDLPAGAVAGDRVRVLYHPDRREGFIYSFDLVWRIPAIAAILGAASVFVGLYFRRRYGGLFRVSHEPATGKHRDAS